MPFRLRSYSGVSCEAVQPITALTPLLRHLVQNLAAQSTPPAALPSNQQPASSTARNNSDLTATSSGRSLPLPSQSTAESSSGRNALPLNLPVLNPIQSRTSDPVLSAPSNFLLPAASPAPAKLAARTEIAAQPVEVEEDDDETPDESNWPPPRIVPAVVPASSISGGVVAVGSATVGLQAASRVVPSSPKRPLPIPAQTGPSTPSRKKTTKRRRLLLEEDDEDATVV